MALYAIFYVHEHGLTGEVSQGLAFSNFHPTDPSFNLRPMLQLNRRCRFCGVSTRTCCEIRADSPTPPDVISKMFTVNTQTPLYVHFYVHSCKACLPQANKRNRDQRIEFDLKVWSLHRNDPTILRATPDRKILTGNFVGDTALIGFRKLVNVTVRDGDAFIYGHPSTELEDVTAPDGTIDRRSFHPPKNVYFRPKPLLAAPSSTL